MSIALPSSDSSDSSEVERPLWRPRARAGAVRRAGWARYLVPPIGTIIAAVAARPFGLGLSAATVVLLAAGAAACLRWPAKRTPLAAATGLFALSMGHPAFAVYESLVVLGLFLVRRSSWRLLALATLAFLVVPKMLFREHYHEPAFYRWLYQPGLALAFFVTLYLWRQQRDGRAPAVAAQVELASFCVLFWLPGHAVHPMAFGPSDLWRAPTFDVHATARSATRALAKAALMLAWQRGAVTWSYASLAALGWQQSRGHLWMSLGWSYGATLLQLAGTAEVAVLIAHLFGFPLAPAFRWAFLAWNPVELWRRWGIYNRRILLSLVYFPLGGNRDHRWRNVLLTFVASALVLHSGWFGSIYWVVGPGGWRDETLYFVLQGSAVCACLAFWSLRSRGSTATEAPSARTGVSPQSSGLRFTLPRVLTTLATQAFSAWAHVIVLAQGLSLIDRLHLMWRCLGGGP